MNAFVSEQVPEFLRGLGFGEGPGKWRHVGDLHLVTHAAFLEEAVGEKGELEWGDRALDRHLGDLHDQLAALPGCQLFAECRRTFEGVKVVDALAPFAAEHALGLFRSDARTRGDDEQVVADVAPVFQGHLVVMGIDALDLRDLEIDPLRHEGPLGFDDVLLLVVTEGIEEKPGLVVVTVVPVEHRDAPLATWQITPQVMRDHGAGGSTAKNEGSFFHGLDGVGDSNVIFQRPRRSPSLKPVAWSCG